MLRTTHSMRKMVSFRSVVSIYNALYSTILYFCSMLGKLRAETYLSLETYSKADSFRSRKDLKSTSLRRRTASLAAVARGRHLRSPQPRAAASSLRVVAVRRTLSRHPAPEASRAIRIPPSRCCCWLPQQAPSASACSYPSLLPSKILV